MRDLSCGVGRVNAFSMSPPRRMTDWLNKKYRFRTYSIINILLPMAGITKDNINACGLKVVRKINAFSNVKFWGERVANRQEKETVCPNFGLFFWLTTRWKLLTKSKSCNRGPWQATRYTGFRDHHIISCSGLLVSSSSNPPPLIPIPPRHEDKGLSRKRG